MTQNTISRRRFLRATAGVATGGVIGACSSPRPSVHPAAGNGLGAIKPRVGGQLIWATNSEEAGLDPTANAWGQTGYAYARTIFDPLAIIDERGNVRPYLARWISANPDFTQWRVGLRPGISYHDGAPLDAAGVATFFDRMASSPLAGAALTPIAKITTADPLTVVVDLKTPWAAFGHYLAIQQLAYPPSPNTWSNPNRATHPSGTGPFMLKEWVHGDHLTGVRNPRYWRAGLPFLEQVTFKPLVDPESATNSLRAGNVDAVFAASVQQTLSFRNDRHFWFVDNSDQTLGEPNVTTLMVNTAKPPLDDLRLRQAMALATDRQRILKVVFQGVGKPCDGPFLPGSPYYAPTGYPTYDPVRAKDLVAQAKRDRGPIRVELSTLQNSTLLQLVQFIADLWQGVGINTSVAQFEQSTFVSNALLGNYDVVTWVIPAALDPDANYIWWSASTVRPLGQYSLNFSRNRDDQIQRALDSGRASSDPAARAEAYQTVGRRLAADLPYIYLKSAFTAMMGSLTVQNANFLTSPEGARAVHFDGFIFPTQIWRS